MLLTPPPNPLHMGRVAEVVSIVRFVQPAPLAGGLAGPATRLRPTEELPVGVMNVGSEECFAAAALASARLELHQAPNGKKTQAFDQS
jgi:hypothetical protein